MDAKELHLDCTSRTSIISPTEEGHPWETAERLSSTSKSFHMVLEDNHD